MSEEHDAAIQGRFVAIELAITTILTAVVKGESGPERVEYAERMRRDALESFHVLSFPENPYGTLVRHETAEAIDRMHDNLVARLKDDL